MLIKIITCSLEICFSKPHIDQQATRFVPGNDLQSTIKQIKFAKLR